MRQAVDRAPAAARLSVPLAVQAAMRGRRRSEISRPTPGWGIIPARGRAMSFDDAHDLAERREAIQSAGSILIERLQKLVRKGYQPDFDTESTGAIWLRHPAPPQRWPHRMLILFPNALVVSAEVEDPAYRFEVWEHAKFERFLQQIPAPRLSDRSRRLREDPKLRILFWIGVFCLAALVSFGANKLARFLAF